MYKITISEAVREALRIAGKTESEAIDWQTKVRLVNHTYATIYNQLATVSSLPFIDSFITTEQCTPLPPNCAEVIEVRPYKGEERFGLSLKRADNRDLSTPYQWTTRGGHIYIPGSGTFVVQYIPTPASLSFTAKPIRFSELDSHDIISVDDDYIYSSKTSIVIEENEDGPVEVEETIYYRTNIDSKIMEVTDNVLYPPTDYYEYTNVRVEDDTISSDEETNLFGVNNVKSVAFNEPYFYINYNNGKCEGLEGERAFLYDPMIDTGRHYQTEVLASFSNDLTGYGNVVRIGTKIFYAGFRGTDTLWFPSNAYYPYFEIMLAISFSGPEEASPYIQTLYEQRFAQFTNQITIDQNITPADDPVSYGYK